MSTYHAPYPVFVDVPLRENASCYGRITCKSNHSYCIFPKLAQFQFYHILENSESDGKQASRILVRILISKQHQIRLLMKCLKHSIIEDHVHIELIDYKSHRIMLHA
ncbi:unnamed protein product [Rotaria sp. Silwood1]|nr:unnamed protein product [Rotaria sp. Silwood1]